MKLPSGAVPYGLLAILLAFMSSAWSAETISLVVPDTSTRESRTADMDRCISIAKESNHFARGLIGPFERQPLLGQSTGRFLKDSRPAASEDAVPTRYGSLLGVNWGQSALSDRYVLCLLAKGYRWPESLRAQPDSGEDGDAISPADEAATLYESGRILRLRGLSGEAARLLQKSVGMDEKRFPDESEWMLVALGELASAYLQLDKIELGMPYVNRLFPHADKYPNQRQFLSWVMGGYAKHLRTTGNSQEAERLETRVKELAR